MRRSPYLRLALAIVVVCVPLAVTAPHTVAAPASMGYVTNQGGQLEQHGHVLILRGFTTYPADDGGSAAWARPAFASYITTHILAQAQAAGQNLIRPTDQFDSHTTLQWNNATVWANMDALIAGAAARGMYVLLDLSFMAKVLTAHGLNPMAAPLWYPMIDAVATRYRSATNIVAISFLGEPQYPTTQAQLAALATFYGSLLNRWYSHDPYHLLTPGGLTHLMYGLPGWWQSLDTLPHVSMVSFKTYSLHDEQYQTTVDSFAHSHGLALDDEEFGLQQQMGDATWSGVVYNGLRVSRSAFYTWVYQHAASGGWAMAIFWNSACNLGATNYDVSAHTPAVWSVVLQHAPRPPVGSPVC